MHHSPVSLQSTHLSANATLLLRLIKEFSGSMESYKGLCEVCDKSFTMRKDLYQHLRSFHDIEVHLNDGKEMCWICGKIFSSSAALDRHCKTHAPAPQKLSCTVCGTFTCSTRKDLRGHLESEHGLNMETKEMDFDSWEQFIHWKLTIESDERVSFIKNAGEKMIDNEKSWFYYICHRTGTPASKSLGKRCRSPSIKIGHTCPASLTVTSVKFYMTHTGHNLPGVSPSYSC